MIFECSCQGNGGTTHAARFQDATYGVGQRVHTPMMADDMFRCTICGAEHKKPGKTLSKREEKALREEKKAKAKDEQERRRR